MTYRKPSSAHGAVVRWTVNPDARTVARVTWAKHVARLSMKSQVSPSVLFRRALALYTEHLDALIRAGDEDALKSEGYSLQRAASGEKQEIDEELLLTNPVRPFGDIVDEVNAADAEEAKAEIQRLLKSKFPGGDRFIGEYDDDDE